MMNLPSGDDDVVNLMRCLFLYILKAPAHHPQDFHCTIIGWVGGRAILAGVFFM